MSRFNFLRVTIFFFFFYRLTHYYNSLNRRRISLDKISLNFVFSFFSFHSLDRKSYQPFLLTKKIVQPCLVITLKAIIVKQTKKLKSNARSLLDYNCLELWPLTSSIPFLYHHHRYYYSFIHDKSLRRVFQRKKEKDNVN